MAFDPSALFCLYRSNVLNFRLSRSPASIGNSRFGKIGIPSTSFSRTSSLSSTTSRYSSTTTSFDINSHYSLCSPSSFDQRTRIASSATRTQEKDCCVGSILAEECRRIIGERTRNYSGDDAKSGNRDRGRGTLFSSILFLLLTLD